MAQFKIGYNFNMKLPMLLDELNHKYEGTERRITEVYGSLARDAVWAARPDFRLPDLEYEALAWHVDALKNVGIDFNYTLNTPWAGGKDELEALKPQLDDLLDRLSDYGVEWLTITNPLIFRFVVDHPKRKDFKLELSTIAHLDTITQIRYYSQHFGIERICGNVWRNRDVGFLKEAVRVCKEVTPNITYSIMVNEFCANGGGDDSISFTSHCVYRDSCYMHHADTKTMEQSLKFDNYPMHSCVASRDTSMSSWLKTRFTLPQHIQLYDDIGVSHFKITGRTADLPYIVMQAEAYLSKRFDGNLLEMWKPLETIWNGIPEHEMEHALHIDCSKLDDFMNMWFGKGREDFRCAEVDCGVTCRYCDDYFRQRSTLDEDNPRRPGWGREEHSSGHA